MGGLSVGVWGLRLWWRGMGDWRRGRGDGRVIEYGVASIISRVVS